ncbi:MAG: DEAD/DEAH box helicase [Rhodospirillaceae bacterium]|nr:DEAD/DEAH box helicase [Rhodospirillaceae bacterium]
MAFPPTHSAFARALSERDYTEPTEVQAAVLTPEATGQDLLVSAQTGSGKTVAFGLAIGATLLGDAEVLEHAPDPLALIIAPTRELALQVHRELTWLYQHTGARIVSAVGGMDPQMERRAINRGCHIVVGTPGRLRDHTERGTLRLTALKAAVLDEADEMLDLGFREDLEYLLKAAPEDRRTLLFSATLPKEIVALARNFQRDAVRIAASGGQRSHADIEYRVMRVAPHDIEHAVVNVLRYFESPSALVFCNTRDTVRHLSAILLERGFAVVTLSGEFSQTERNRALQALRDGKARVCVATDVAARGIDLPNLNLVIHADIPNSAETLQHRSGRTGRAGRKGVSVLLVPPSRKRRTEMMLSAMKVQAVWSNPPNAESIAKLDDERLMQRMLEAEAGTEADLALARQLLEKRTAEDLAAILVRMHRAQMPAPEDIADQGPVTQPRDYAPRDGKPSREPRPPAGPRYEGPMVWFRLNIGRNKNADPKWLIPEICGQGGITKREIGSIRIFDDETKFEIAEPAAAAFAARVAESSSKGMVITPSDAPGPGSSRAPREAKPFKTFGKPAAENKFREKKPWKKDGKKSEGNTFVTPAPEGKKPDWKKPEWKKRPEWKKPDGKKADWKKPGEGGFKKDGFKKGGFKKKHRKGPAP